MVTEFPTQNPKLQVLEILAQFLESYSQDDEFRSSLEKLLTVENYEIIADANSIYHRAVWSRILRFIAYQQDQLGPEVISRIRLRFQKIDRSKQHVKS